MNQIELLLRLSENAQDRGDEIAEQYNQTRAAHMKELHRLMVMIDAAKQNVEAELRRFGAAPSQPQLARQDDAQPPRVGPPQPRPVKLPGDSVKAN